MYTQDLIDALLHHTDIVQVISSYITVTKKGKNYVALCPFHDDKNPSLSISVEKQIFKCFVCGAGGNAITFVQRYEKIPFNQAVRKVAQIVGFIDPRLDQQFVAEKVDENLSKLYACIDDLQTYYKYGLTVEEGQKAREYLASRNIDAKQIEAFGIGYALRDGGMAIRYLQAKGHSLKSIEDIGIALQRGDQTYDSNAGRLMIPVHDPKGHLVGFSSRRLEDDGTPKYINSPETSLFKKNSLLYNYHRAKESARREGYCYIVEGFMDVMALEKAGIPAIATMGTALTGNHVGLLKQMRCEIRVCLDGDMAGQMGMMRIVNALSKTDIPVRVVDYGDDKRDPDDILREEGPDGLKAKLNRLIDAVDFQINYYVGVKRLETQEDRRKVLNSFLPYLASRPAGIEFEEALQKLSKATGYDSEAIRKLVNQPGGKSLIEDGAVFEEDAIAKKQAPDIDDALFSKIHSMERTILSYMMHYPDAIEYYQRKIGTLPTSIYLTVAEYLVEYHSLHPDAVDISQFVSFVSATDPADPRVLDCISSIAISDIVPPYDESALTECAQSMEVERQNVAAKLKTKQTIQESTPEAAAQANKELAERLKRQWQKKKKGS